MHEAAHLAPWSCSCAHWLRTAEADHAHQLTLMERLDLSVAGTTALALPARFVSQYAGSRRRPDVRIEEDWADAHAMWSVTERRGAVLLALGASRIEAHGLRQIIRTQIAPADHEAIAEVIDRLTGGRSTARVEMCDLFPNRVALIRREWGATSA